MPLYLYISFFNQLRNFGYPFSLRARVCMCARCAVRLSVPVVRLLGSPETRNALCFNLATFSPTCKYIYKSIKYTYNSIRISISIICDMRTHRALTIISEDFGAWHATFVWVSGCKHKVQILLIMECAVCLCSPFPCAILGRSFVLWCTFSPASDFSIYSLRYFYYICLTCPSLYANRYADAATNPTRRCCCIGGADSGGD